MQKRKTVAVYTPYLQGFYFGELLSQLQQYCFLKGYAFMAIKTDSFGEFTSTLLTEHFDYAIILRNAIHNELAEYLVQQGKPVASIAYDYFPLAIPMVTSDNSLGTELAFNHLVQQGHRNLAFVGDLSQFDIRKRYEAFCDQHEINNFELNDDNVFVVHDTQFTGGYQAANEFHESHCTATGVVCGASLTSIGFAQQLQHLRGDDIGVNIVGFDAISLIPVTQPNMAMVDQNLHLMAQKTLDVIDKIAAGISQERHHLVEPKLISATSNTIKSQNIFLETSTEFAELHNANYMKSIINNLYEWPKNIANNNLETLMSLAPMFEKHLKKACFGRTVIGKDGKEYIKVTQTFSLLNTQKTLPTNMGSITTAAQYPASCANVVDDFIDSSTHIPIFQSGRLWSVLSVYGSSTASKKASSYSALCAYLDNITSMLLIKMLSSQRAPLEPKLAANTSAQAPKGTITWAPSTNTMTWDNNALGVLGLTTPLEQSIYRNMELTDRIHPDDDDILRECLLEAKERDFVLECRLKHKIKNHLNCQILRSQVNNEGAITLQLTRTCNV